jgi:hypothetical protein
MAEILYAPGRENIVTTNAWAFLHWLRTAYGVDLPDWAALQRWSAVSPTDFSSAIAAFARLPDGPIKLVRHHASSDALILRRSDGTRLALSGEQLRQPLPAEGPVPAGIAGPLTRDWPVAALVRPIADVLLHADLRPDDRLLVVGSAWPWLTALLEGVTIIAAAVTPGDLLITAAEDSATVLVAPAQMLARAAFPRQRDRPDLSRLRTIVTTGGPVSPEGRRRIYTWVKSDLMLLARTGDTFWGNPIEPVLAQPPATPAFLTPQPSGQATQ